MKALTHTSLECSKTSRPKQTSRPVLKSPGAYVPTGL